MSAFRWIVDNFPGLLAFGLALAALAVSEYESARFFLLMMVLFGISKQVADLRDRMDKADKARDR